MMTACSTSSALDCRMFVLTVLFQAGRYISANHFDKPLAASAAAAYQWAMNKVRLHSTLRVAHNPQPTISPCAEASNCSISTWNLEKARGRCESLCHFVAAVHLSTCCLRALLLELTAPASLPPHFSCLLSFPLFHGLPTPPHDTRLNLHKPTSRAAKMVSDNTYELCLPILQDATLEDEDKTDKLEELLKKETTLTGGSLDNAILDILWRFREGPTSASSPPPLRHTVLRRPSPAPWQIPRGAASPASSSPRLGVTSLASSGIPPSFSRGKSSTASPFTSPRPSPRLAFSSPAIPHSPSLNAYEFPTDTSPTQDIYGDYGSDNVDWIVNDDTASNTSSSVGGQQWAQRSCCGVYLTSTNGYEPL